MTRIDLRSAPRYQPIYKRVREERLNSTPPGLASLLVSLRYDDPITCLSFMCEQRLDTSTDDFGQLLGWMVATFDVLRRAGRTPDLPNDIPVESACLYVLDFWITAHIEAHKAEDPDLLLDVKPPTVKAYYRTTGEMR